MRKQLTLATIAFVAFATSAYAVGEARITGKVVDGTGAPLEGVTIQIEAVSGKTVKQTAKTNKKGEYAAFLIDGTIQYKFTYSKDGFGSYTETMKLKLIPEKNERNITLTAGGTAPAPAGAEAAPAKADPSVALYNEGVTLANEGKDAEAIAKFEEAIAARPDLAAGYNALVRVYGRQKNWAKVIERGTKALELTPDEAGVLTLMAEAYDKTGDKAKAAEFRKKAPANPVTLFNDAARLINGGKDGEAEPLLKQALSLDANFAPAHYELGMIYVRSGKNADAKTHLNKYLELEPKGKDAPVAKEMLSYVN
jgi:tetratricopeptide (TPR) repeat protein